MAPVHARANRGCKWARGRAGAWGFCAASRPGGRVGIREVRASTLNERRRLYLQARVVVARHYRRDLTLETVSQALSCSSRQLQRAYAQFGEFTFHEDLVARRMRAAAELLAGQAIPIRDVARLVGYRNAAHFAGAFRRRFGVSPAHFRAQARRHGTASAA
jgi:AraC-like DNA-binding protein